MIFAEKEITLKNGTVAVLRSPCAGEGGKMLKYIRQACGETDFLLRRPEEWGSVTVESEEKWISGGLESDSILRIACFIGDEVAGNCEVMFNNWQKNKPPCRFYDSDPEKILGTRHRHGDVRRAHRGGKGASGGKDRRA